MISDAKSEAAAAATIVRGSGSLTSGVWADSKGLAHTPFWRSPLCPQHSNIPIAPPPSEFAVSVIVFVVFVTVFAVMVIKQAKK
ncbi:hypothetical protein [Bifidobacterium pseudolongum]|uniref:hypothetical protein n=1 Tax=Bifidobacterium pseudolongum TaxID=1694 RepID=UPI00102166D0|nr:hypothetical protein [Bifidobacterium pseudolongum]